MAAADERRVMCVGLCCVDIVSIVQSFPVEDSDQRYAIIILELHTIPVLTLNLPMDLSNFHFFWNSLL
jgi:hypothetical protein